MDPMHSQEAGELDGDNARGQAPANSLLQPWYVPESHFEELPGVMCATDLLVAWEPETAVSPLTEFGTAGVWETYFQGSAAATALPASLSMFRRSKRTTKRGIQMPRLRPSNAFSASYMQSSEQT